MSDNNEVAPVSNASEPVRVHPREKFPQLWVQFEQLQAEKAELDKVVNPLREARDQIVAEMAPLEARARDLATKIREHMPRMGELDRQISGLARAMGGARMSESNA